MAYVDGYLIPVPHGERERYIEMAWKAAELFKRHGATRVVECWSDDVPEGAVTSFGMAVKREADEGIVFSWVEWPSREARDAGNAKVMADPSMQPSSNGMPFDGKRMMMGGFEPILES